MKTTQKQQSLNLKKLENILNKYVSKKSLDIGNMIINCLEQEQIITILVQHSPPVSQSPQQVINYIKNIVNQKTFHNVYQFQICLAIYGQSPYINEQFRNILIKSKLKKPSKSKYFSLLFGSSFLIVSVIYLLTRPCVIGKCTSITKAQQLAANSRQLIQEEDIVSAENQLKIALKLLRAIPWFSPYHTESQEIINQYQNTFNNLQTTLTIFQQSNQAIINSQKSELSLEELKNIQTTLKQAIVNLNNIAQTTEFKEIAQNTQEIYQLELERIKNLYQQEIQGENDILTATEMAKIALIRQEKAKSLEDWQLLDANWRLVMERLQNIKPENIMYPQAQELLTKYQANLQATENKLRQEKNTYQTYQQALNFAEQAKNLVKQQQYSLAIENWNKALENLLKINETASIFPETKNLIANYETSLKNTRQQLNLAENRQKANQDLNQICVNQEKICTYRLETNNIIKVYLNPQYLQKVLQIAISNQSQGDLLQHISSVQKALETVSNKYKLPLEIYHSDGDLLFSYNPN